MCAVAGCALRRRARTFGQRSFWFVVDPRPSVIESPITTIAADLGFAPTSIEPNTYQWSTATAFGIVGAETASPTSMNDVVREPGWPVTFVGIDVIWMLTLRFSKGVTANGTSSERMNVPGWITTEEEPLNCRTVSLSGSMASAPVERAMCAEAIVRGASPYPLENDTRSRLPARVG